MAALSQFFRAVGIPLLEAYGLTEGSLNIFNRVDDFRCGTAGKPLPGTPPCTSRNPRSGVDADCPPYGRSNMAAHRPHRPLCPLTSVVCDVLSRFIIYFVRFCRVGGSFIAPCPGAAWDNGGRILRRIKRILGVLAVTALAVAGLSAGSASAATQPIPHTKAAWQAAIAHVREPGRGCYSASYPALAWHDVTCVAAPKLPLVPAPLSRSARHAGPETTGDGQDYSAQVSGLISQATGTFQNVSSGITEKGQTGGSGSKVKNSFSLQLNTQFFSGSPACSGSSDPSGCQAWQQFVYTYEDSSTSYIFMQYWLINYDATCPSGWYTYSEDCYTNSNAADVSTVTASQLATVQLSGSATSGGSDGVSLSVGSGQATTVTADDSTIDLASHWNTTEWGVFGDGGGSEADFGANTSLEAQTALTASSGSSAPACVSEGFTGETNNLSLTATPALGSESSPTMASEQTNGTSGTASCAVAG